MNFRAIPLPKVEIKDICFKNVSEWNPVSIVERLEMFIPKDCNQVECFSPEIST